MHLDKRAHTLLKTLIERYIEDGVPVGSKALAQISGLDLSSATIRNIMVDLEHMGFVSSPHTSAGRVPTPLGYRFFVDTLLVSDALPDLGSQNAGHQLAAYLQNQVSALHQHVPGNSPQKLIASAAQTLSSLSRFAGVVLAPKRDTTFHQIEFVRIAEKKILVVIVSPNGEIQNRLLMTSTDYTTSMLSEAANYLTHHYRGLDFAEIRRRLQSELKQLQSEMTTLMQDAVDAGSEAVSDQSDDIVISGERNLFSVSELSSNMTSLHQMVDLFEKKTHLMQLLDLSGRASGIRIYIGGESDLVPVDQMSVIASGYEVNGKVVGTLGVIGPTRMAYDKMIPIVEITAKLLSNALSQNS